MSKPAITRGTGKIVRRTAAGDESPLLLWEALKWHKAMIFGWVAAGIAVSATGVFLTRPHYTATVELLLGVGSGNAANAAVVESQLKTLKSDRLAQSVIDRLGLWNDPELSQTTSLPLEQLFGIGNSHEAIAATESVGRETVLNRFKEATSVARSGRSFVVNVSFTSTRPQVAAAAANALATEYVNYQSIVQTRGVEQTGERLEARILRLREKLAAATAAVERQKNGGKQASDAERQDALRALETDAQTYRSIYEALLARYARSVHERASPLTEARIISEAVPPSRWSTPRVTVVLLLAASAGGFIGFALALRREHAARPVRSLEQIEREIGFPALGIVPLVHGRRLHPAQSHAPPLLLHDRDDALRGIKLAVDEVCRADCCVIGVVSAYQGEGKSTVAFNLSVLEAESRRRVLLIDANLHRPMLGRSLALGTLLAPLEGSATLSDSIARSELGFDFIGERSAETPVHPAVLLGSPAMRDLISSARGLYDCIVCDLPNILGHADVRAAADLFDALVLVAEWGRTPTAAATRAVLKSTAISDRLVGIIINKAPGAKRTNA
jgi:succinoglycan biosynthesis transport protein ExoP